MANEPNDFETTLHDLRQVVRQFVDERDWQHFHDAKNLSMSLAIEAAELMEHFQWLTSQQVLNVGSLDKTAIAEELADVVCYALALANSLDIDISASVCSKMVKNRLKYPVGQSYSPFKGTSSPL